MSVANGALTLLEERVWRRTASFASFGMGTPGNAPFRFLPVGTSLLTVSETPGIKASGSEGPAGGISDDDGPAAPFPDDEDSAGVFSAMGSDLLDLRFLGAGTFLDVDSDLTLLVAVGGDDGPAG